MVVEQVLKLEVVEFAEHFDALEFARRAGLMPARGSGGERALVRLQRLRARLGW